MRKKLILVYQDNLCFKSLKEERENDNVYFILGFGLTSCIDIGYDLLRGKIINHSYRCYYTFFTTMDINMHKVL